MDIRTGIINNIVQSMQETLSEEQLQTLKNSLYIQLNNYEVHQRTTEIALVDDNSPDSMLRKYIATKRIEGIAESTLKRYADENGKLIHYLNKPLNEVTTFDIRFYLAMRKEQSITLGRSLSNRSLDGMRRCYKSFFTFLYNEELIPKNPTAALTQIKYEKTIKKPFSYTDMEKLKRSCFTIRDRAIVEFLYSTGCRISELVALNRNDIDFTNLNVVVFGKGKKERPVYITEVAAMYLKEYLDSRTDSDPCLFAKTRAPYTRISKNGIESMLKKLGEKAGVANVHPHRYRRTLATNMLDRGANIQDVASILGHEDLKTTQIYCFINQERVRTVHGKYIA